MSNIENTDPIDSPSTNHSEENKFLIAGIGASAGGIKALKEFFKHVPVNSGVAYVVILHLSPEFESQLAHVLQANSLIPVTQVQEERVKVQPDHVYVIPPNRSLTMIDGFLALSTPESFEERRAPIDIFFRTLAQSNDGRSVAVILSGTGSDGSMGMKRVKEHGGIVLVQDPNEAEYGDMPRNSIAQGLVDFILPVSQIPKQIAHYREQRKHIQIVVKKEEESQEEEHERALRQIFTQLRIKTGHDFSNYKRATVLRRIERRMNVRETPDLPAYASIIEREKEEPVFLLKDLLISVTNFFRDKTSFAFLETEIIPKIFDNKSGSDIVRIWVAACATGEEAYSIAMLCAERLSSMGTPPFIQIFATDIDSQALAVAREGLYSNADVADVSPERLRRFFQKEGSGFRIRRELRETILFARHNILKDPPFSRLDLGACRNLLIYLNRAAQDRVIDAFHFALNPGGYLFLGSSETIDGNSNLYSTTSREHCIYQSRAVVSRPVVPISEPPVAVRFPEFDRLSASPNEYKHLDRMSAAGLHHQLLELYAPPSVLVDAQHNIIHVSKSAGRYLQISGEPSLNLLSVVLNELRLELRSALYSAAQMGSPAEVTNLRVQIAGKDETINLVVKPVSSEPEAAKGFLLVLFQPSVDVSTTTSLEPTVSVSSNEPIVQHLEEELLHMRSQFRHLFEQYEVQTEEFKASNEELQAINEELRSAAEELETSKEELQSVNEELSTVNQELKIKIEELSQANNDFKNLIDATDIGTVFLDRSFSVNLFTPSACSIFNLKAADYGRPLTDITNRLLSTGITADLENVLATLQPTEREVETVDSKTYLMRILPYRTAEDHINGVVMTFIDITARKNAEEALRSSEERIRAMFNQARAGVVQTDLEGRLTMVNHRFCSMLGYNEEAVLGKHIKDFLVEEDRTKHLLLMGQLFEDGKAFDTEQRYICKDGNFFWLHNSATLIHNRNGTPQSILYIVIDINSQKLTERQKEEFIGIASHELKTPMTSIKAYAEILLERFRQNGDEQAEKLTFQLNNQVKRMVNLIKELLNTTLVTAGRFTINKAPFNLLQLIREVVEAMQHTTKTHKLLLELEEIPMINADRDRIEQVLTNLIDNAIKYAPDTTNVVISSNITGNMVRVCVRDFGDGLSEEAKKNIFNKFYREENHLNANSLGLGLFICMEIAKLHGGVIEVEGSKGNGATFCLLLPLSEK